MDGRAGHRRRGVHPNPLDLPGCIALAALSTAAGGRNHALNAAAFALGQLTATGLLPADLASDALAQAAQAICLPTREAAATIRSGLTAGARSPRRFAVGTRP